MNKIVAILGAGGHSRVIASILHELKFPILGFFDDSFHGKEIIQGAPVLGNFEDILNYKDRICSAYLAIGQNDLRERIYSFLQTHGFKMPPLVHPTALIAEDAIIGEGSVVCMGAIVATEVKVGKGVIINTGSSVDHECKIGDFVHLAPKVVVGGRAQIESFTFVGINACIADKIYIGERATVGAGSVVLRDIGQGQAAVGIHH